MSFKNLRKIIFFILNFCIFQSIEIHASLSHENIYGISKILKPEYEFLSLAYGYVHLHEGTIENSLRYGSSQDPLVRMMGELFHTVSPGDVRATQHTSKLGCYLKASTIVKIINFITFTTIENLTDEGAKNNLIILIMNDIFDLETEISKVEDKISNLEQSDKKNKAELKSLQQMAVTLKKRIDGRDYSKEQRKVLNSVKQFSSSLIASLNSSFSRESIYREHLPIHILLSFFSLKFTDSKQSVVEFYSRLSGFSGEGVLEEDVAIEEYLSSLKFKIMYQDFVASRYKSTEDFSDIVSFLNQFDREQNSFVVARYDKAYVHAKFSSDLITQHVQGIIKLEEPISSFTDCFETTLRNFVRFAFLKNSLLVDIDRFEEKLKTLGHSLNPDFREHFKKYISLDIDINKDFAERNSWAKLTINIPNLSYVKSTSWGNYEIDPSLENFIAFFEYHFSLLSEDKSCDYSKLKTNEEKLNYLFDLFSDEEKKLSVGDSILKEGIVNPQGVFFIPIMANGIERASVKIDTKIHADFTRTLEHIKKSWTLDLYQKIIQKEKSLEASPKSLLARLLYLRSYVQDAYKITSRQDEYLHFVGSFFAHEEKFALAKELLQKKDLHRYAESIEKLYRSTPLDDLNTQKIILENLVEFDLSEFKGLSLLRDEITYIVNQDLPRFVSFYDNKNVFNFLLSKIDEVKEEDLNASLSVAKVDFGGSLGYRDAMFLWVERNLNRINPNLFVSANIYEMMKYTSKKDPNFPIVLKVRDLILENCKDDIILSIFSNDPKKEELVDRMEKDLSEFIKEKSLGGVNFINVIWNVYDSASHGRVERDSIFHLLMEALKQEPELINSKIFFQHGRSPDDGTTLFSEMIHRFYAYERVDSERVDSDNIKDFLKIISDISDRIEWDKVLSSLFPNFQARGVYNPLALKVLAILSKKEGHLNLYKMIESGILPLERLYALSDFDGESDKSDDRISLLQGIFENTEFKSLVLPHQKDQIIHVLARQLRERPNKKTWKIFKTLIRKSQDQLLWKDSEGKTTLDILFKPRSFREHFLSLVSSPNYSQYSEFDDLEDGSEDIINYIRLAKGSDKETLSESEDRAEKRRGKEEEERTLNVEDEAEIVSEVQAEIVPETDEETLLDHERPWLHQILTDLTAGRPLDSLFISTLPARFITLAMSILSLQRQNQGRI